MDGDKTDISKQRFMVCIDEIQQNFVFGAEFSGQYCKTITLSDGTCRTVELTPMIRDGQPVVQFKDTGGCTYMGLNGTTTNGRLMVQIRDLDSMESQLRSNPPSSPVPPRDTSLIDAPEFVPPGFAQGVEILNDNLTPMEFVTSVLTTYLGLTPENAHRTMLQIHSQGGALLATPSLDDARRAAALITAEAAKHGHPLVCRAVLSRQE